MPPDAPMPPAAGCLEHPQPDRHTWGCRDEQTRLLCTSPRKHNRGPCDGAAVTGFPRCKMHLGISVAQARKEVQDAIGALAVEALGIAWKLANDKKTPAAVRATLVRDILDRAGHGATRRVDVRNVDLTDPAAKVAEAAAVRDELAERREQQRDAG